MENSPELNVNEKLQESMIELILSKVPENDILNCNLVCRTWRNIIGGKSLWKKRFENKNVSWRDVPTHVRNKPWMILHAYLEHGILSKNYIQNASGEHELDGWVFECAPAAAKDWKIEQPPLGCEPLPVSPFFSVNGIESCFTTSFSWLSKYYWIDLESLRKKGLTTGLLKLMLPFQINCSQMYTTRFDRGGWFGWELRLLNSKKEIISKYKPPSVKISPNLGWQTAHHSFEFGSADGDLIGDLSHIVFLHGGKDSQYTYGYSGPKFARSCVTFECLEREPNQSSKIERFGEYYGKYGGISGTVSRRNRKYRRDSHYYSYYEFFHDAEDDKLAFLPLIPEHPH